MKKISFVFFLIFLTISINAQNIVTKVIGKIKKADGTVVRIGTKLYENEILSFSTKQDALRMIVPGKGTYTVTPGSSAVQKNNVWVILLSKSSRLKNSADSLSSRGELYEKIPDAFKTITSINQFTLITNSKPNKYLFNTTDYDVSNGSRFILQGEQEGKVILKKIVHTSNDTLLLYRSDFQTDNIKGSKPLTYTIGFFNKPAFQTSAVLELKPYFDDAGEMEAILHTLISSNKNKTKIQLQQLCYNEVYKALGRPSDIFFYTTFDKISQDINKPIAVNTNQSTGLIEDEIAYENLPETVSNTMRDQIELPEQFSLRQYTPPVQAQGGYGTCAAWSCAYAARTISWAIRNKYNNIDNAADIVKYSFSPQYLFVNIKSQGDVQCKSGANIVTALGFIKNNGVALWDKSPYDCGATYSDKDKATALNYKIKDIERLCSFFNINDSAITNMKRTLTEKKPIVVAMHLPNSFDSVDTKTGIWYPNPNEYKEAKTSKQYKIHAMCIIGYNDAVNGGSFEIMNSWGTKNGKDGFYWVSYDDMKIFGSQLITIKDM